MFYPDKHRHENVFDEPDRDRIHKEMAKLRNHVFSDFGEVAAAVRGCLSERSAHPFQKREGSRYAVFSEAGARSCARLPSVRYDAAQRAYGRAVNHRSGAKPYRENTPLRQKGLLAAHPKALVPFDRKAQDLLICVKMRP